MGMLHLLDRVAKGCITGALAVAVIPVLAGQVVGGPILAELTPTGRFTFDLDGEEVSAATILAGDRDFVVLAPGLTAGIRITLPSLAVYSVSTGDLMRRVGGAMAIPLVDPAAVPVTTATLKDKQELRFPWEGKQAALRPKPPLLGEQNGTSLREYDPSYARAAESYEPNAESIAFLRGIERDVQVVAYFGTWCRVCDKLVPAILKTEAVLEGSRVAFRYYGLPQRLADDPVTTERTITGVPMAVVSVDGKEVGRAGTRELSRGAEVAIKEIVAGSL